ncbi:MAG: branched-chain amino acid ABC transporter permease [Pseudomonadota bacterium]
MLNYLIAMATFAGIYGLLALSLNLAWGLAGMINLGLAGFFAVGAYASALTTTTLSLPILLGLLAALIAAGVAGAALTLVTMRLRDDYLAIVTLGFAEVVRLVALNESWLTRGADGISAIPGPFRAALGAQFNLAYLLFVLALLGLTLLLVERLRLSPLGRVLRAIRDDQQVTAVAGKPVLAFKLKAFAVSAAIAGFAGAIYGHYTSYIVPDIFEPLITIYVFLALTAGGTGNNWGAVLGAFLLIALLESTRFLAAWVPGLSGVQHAAAREMLVGGLLIVVLLVRPRGVLPERLPAPPA